MIQSSADLRFLSDYNELRIFSIEFVCLVPSGIHHSLPSQKLNTDIYRVFTVLKIYIARAPSFYPTPFRPGHFRPIHFIQSY